MIAITPAVPRPVRKKNRNRHRKPVRALRTILPAVAIGMNPNRPQTKKAVATAQRTLIGPSMMGSPAMLR